MVDFYVKLKKGMVAYGLSADKPYRVYDIKYGDAYSRTQFLVYTDHGVFDWVGSQIFQPVLTLERFLDGDDD